jgi:hypothetical protein
MFDKKTTDDLMWAVLLYYLTRKLGGGGQGGPRPLPAGSATTLGEGFYWYFLEWAKDRAPWIQWLRENRGRVSLTKVLGPPVSQYAVVVFEVRPPHPGIAQGPVYWPMTLRGLPTPAPKGANTEIEDIEGKGPSSVSVDTWEEFVNHVMQEAGETIRDYGVRQLQQLNQMIFGSPPTVHGAL